MKYKTQQEQFWAEEFGDAYIERNNSQEQVAGNIAMFSKILGKTSGIKSIIEFGSNVGENLKAIKTLIPSVVCSAIEINHKAAEILSNDDFFKPKVKVYETSILDYKTENLYDFVLIKGVLIHINPNELHNVYQKLYDSSNCYICFAEYYNPVPVSIDYHGNSDKLFKRDFAGEFLNMYSDVKLIDYGFVYHGDNVYDYDDITWFLMEKR